jgi:hypothetical protein
MRQIRYAATRLAIAGKKGILPKDDAGYRTLPVGGLNAFNSAGEWYPAEGAEDLFKDSASLMRNIAKGILLSELGHPAYQPGMTEQQWLNRIMSIDPKNVCAHIRALWLDYDFGRKNPQFKNPKLVAIMAELAPSGPYGPQLDLALDNNFQNVTFSIRGITEDIVDRRTTTLIRVLKSIRTFDQVAEQGIALANKWDAPALESHDRVITMQKLERFVDSPESVAMESSREFIRETIASLKASTLPQIPLSMLWQQK